MRHIKVTKDLLEITNLPIADFFEVLEEEGRMFLHVSMDEAAWLLGGFDE